MLQLRDKCAMAGNNYANVKFTSSVKAKGAKIVVRNLRVVAKRSRFAEKTLSVPLQVIFSALLIVLLPAINGLSNNQSRLLHSLPVSSSTALSRFWVATTDSFSKPAIIPFTLIPNSSGYSTWSPGTEAVYDPGSDSCGNGSNEIPRRIWHQTFQVAQQC